MCSKIIFLPLVSGLGCPRICVLIFLWTRHLLVCVCVRACVWVCVQWELIGADIPTDARGSPTRRTQGRGRGGWVVGGCAGQWKWKWKGKGGREEKWVGKKMIKTVPDTKTQVCFWTCFVASLSFRTLYEAVTCHHCDEMGTSGDIPRQAVTGSY